MRRAFSAMTAALLVAGCGSGGGGNAPTPASNQAAPVNGTVPAPPPSGIGNAAMRSSQVLHLADNGLTIGMPGLPASTTIPFGRPRAEVIAAVSAIRGPVTRTDGSSECGVGAMEFAAFGPLVLNFRSGNFTGWTIDDEGEPVLATQDGLQVGSYRTELVENDLGTPTIEASTLGVEFDLDGVGGILSSNNADGHVTSLYAGETCFAR